MEASSAGAELVAAWDSAARTPTAAVAAAGGGRRETDASNLSEVDAGVTGGAGAPPVAWLGAQALLYGQPHATQQQQRAVGAHAAWETVVTGTGWGQPCADGQGAGPRFRRYDTGSSASTAQDRDSPQRGAALLLAPAADGDRQGLPQRPAATAPALQDIIEETPLSSAAAAQGSLLATSATPLPPWMGATPRRGRLPPIVTTLQAPASSPGAPTTTAATLAPTAGLQPTRSTPGAVRPQHDPDSWHGSGGGGVPPHGGLQLTSRSTVLLHKRAAALRTDLEERLGGAARLGEALEALRRAQAAQGGGAPAAGGRWPHVDVEEEGDEDGVPVALSGLDASLLVRDLRGIVYGRVAPEGQAGLLAVEEGITDLLPALDELLFLERRLGPA